MKFYNDFVNELSSFDDPKYDCTRFDRLIENTHDCVISGISISASKISSIRRFYENTNPYNRSKVVGLINNNITNIDNVHKIVIDYEINQHKKEQ